MVCLLLQAVLLTVASLIADCVLQAGLLTVARASWIAAEFTGPCGLTSRATHTSAGRL
jgi:hypothetical protein